MHAALLRSATRSHLVRPNHTRGLTNGASSQAPATPAGGAVFADASYLNRIVHAYAARVFGSPKLAALDFAPMLPFIARAATALAGAGGSVAPPAAYFYAFEERGTIKTATSSPLVPDTGPNQLGILRALRSEESFVVRTWRPDAAFAFAPSVALAADFVHAAALQPFAAGLDDARSPVMSANGGADKPMSGGAGTLPAHDAPLVALLSSIGMLPPLVRAAQHGRFVLLAALTGDLPLWRSLPAHLRDVIGVLPLDDLLPTIVVSRDAFRIGAPSLSELAVRLYNTMLAAGIEPAEGNSSGSGSSGGTQIFSTEVNQWMGAPSLLKDMRKCGAPVRDILLARPDLFAVGEPMDHPRGGSGRYPVSLLKPRAPVVAPASSVVAGSAGGAKQVQQKGSSARAGAPPVTARSGAARIAPVGGSGSAREATTADAAVMTRGGVTAAERGAREGVTGEAAREVQRGQTPLSPTAAAPAGGARSLGKGSRTPPRAPAAAASSPSVDAVAPVASAAAPVAEVTAVPASAPETVPPAEATPKQVRPSRARTSRASPATDAPSVAVTTEGGAPATPSAESASPAANAAPPVIAELLTLGHKCGLLTSALDTKRSCAALLQAAQLVGNRNTERPILYERLVEGEARVRAALAARSAAAPAAEASS